MASNQLLQGVLLRLNRLAIRFPAVSLWLLARLSLNQFNGLPLTGLVILLVLTGMSLSEVAENIVKTETMVVVDHWFTQFIVQARTTRMNTVMYGLTWLGSIYATVGFGLAGSLVLVWHRKRYDVLILWLLVGGVSLFVQVGKRTFVRQRPSLVAYYVETGYSFPSGHSATAMTLYGLLAYWFIRKQPSRLYQWLIGLAATSLILIVGFSRIYLGVHFLSDVLGGYLLGICWLIIGIVLTEWQHKTSDHLLEE